MIFPANVLRTKSDKPYPSYIKEKKISWAHTPSVAGSNPTPVTIESPSSTGFFVYRHLGLVIRKIAYMKRLNTSNSQLYIRKIFLFYLFIILIFAGSGYAQTEFWNETSLVLKGAIDVHVHTSPDSGPRSVDAFELARIAVRYGMQALLFKNHFTQTASLAYLVNRAVPGIESYGGIVLNNTVGGINLNSVKIMSSMTGGYGRVVWMPTWDSEHYAKMGRPGASIVPISSNGKLLPDVLKVLELIAEKDLSLATGHSSPQESLLLISAAKAVGVQRIIVTHPLTPAVGMTIEQQVEAARLGAFLEYCVNPLLPSDTGKAKLDGGMPIQEMVSYIRAVGIDNAILSTDLGQELNPIHTDGMIFFVNKLLQQGFTKDEINRMVKTNPAKFLGLH